LELQILKDLTHRRVILRGILVLLAHYIYRIPWISEWDDAPFLQTWILQEQVSLHLLPLSQEQVQNEGLCYRVSRDGVAPSSPKNKPSTVATGAKIAVSQRTNHTKTSWTLTAGPKISEEPIFKSDVSEHVKGDHKVHIQSKEHHSKLFQMLALNYRTAFLQVMEHSFVILNAQMRGTSAGDCGQDETP